MGSGGVCAFEQTGLSVIIDNSAKMNRATPQRSTILCVDDEEIALSMRRMLLESAGYTVLTAANSSQGIALFQTHQVDLVITDHLLPGATGSDLARELRRVHPTVPVMILSGGPVLGNAKENPDYFLHKLEGPTKMIAKVQSILRSRGKD
jgi:CheY-like chemotaxis protein